MDFIKQSWELIKETLKKEYSLSEISYNTWVAPLKFYEVKSDDKIIKTLNCSDIIFEIN